MVVVVVNHNRSIIYGASTPSVTRLKVVNEANVKTQKLPRSVTMFEPTLTDKHLVPKPTKSDTLPATS